MTILFMTGILLSGWESAIPWLVVAAFVFVVVSNSTRSDEYWNGLAKELGFKKSGSWGRRPRIVGRHRNTKVTVRPGPDITWDAEMYTVDVFIDFSHRGAFPFDLLYIFPKAFGAGPYQSVPKIAKEERVLTGDERMDQYYGFRGEALTVIPLLSQVVRETIHVMNLSLQSVKGGVLHARLLRDDTDAAALKKQLDLATILIDLVVTPRSDSIWALLAHSAAEDASVGFRRKCLTLLGEYFPTKLETVEAAKRCVESDDEALKQIAAGLLKA